MSLLPSKSLLGSCVRQLNPRQMHGGEMHQEAAEAAKAKAGRLKQQAANLQHEASLNSLAAHLLEDDARDPAWLGGILEGTGGNDQLLLSPKRHLNEHHLGSMNGIRVCMVCARGLESDRVEGYWVKAQSTTHKALASLLQKPKHVRGESFQCGEGKGPE